MKTNIYLDQESSLACILWNGTIEDMAMKKNTTNDITFFIFFVFLQLTCIYSTLSSDSIDYLSNDFS